MTTEPAKTLGVHRPGVTDQSKEGLAGADVGRREPQLRNRQMQRMHNARTSASFDSQSLKEFLHGGLVNRLCF